MVRQPQLAAQRDQRPGEAGGPPVGVVAAIVALLATSLAGPLLGLLRTPPGRVFSGFVEEARDGVSYVAKAAEGASGHWLYHDPYTSEPHAASLIYLPYLLLGQLDRALRLPLPLLLHLASLLLGAWLLWSLWRLAQACLGGQGRGAVTLGFVLAVLGGGIGPLTGRALSLGPYHYVSLDVGVDGTVGLQALEVAPHIVLACLASVRLALLWIERGRAPRRRDLLAVAAWVLAISAAYPQMAALWAVVGVILWALRPGRGAAATALVGAAAAVPYLAYGLWLKASSPIFAAWPPVGDVDVGDPLSYLLFAHLLLLPPAALAGWRAIRHDRESPLLPLAVWVVASAVLMYLPGLPPVMHRLYYGSFAAFGVLAAAGAWSLSRRLAAERARQRLVVYGAALACLAGLHAAFEPPAIVLGHRDDLAVYLPAGDARVLERLAELRPEGGALVMNTYLSGLFVPALSRQTTYIGFPFETLDVYRKDRESRAFYALDQPQALRDRAAQLGLDYVLFGPYERALHGPDPGALAGWAVVARDGDAVLYAVGGGPSGIRPATRDGLAATL